MNNCRNLITPFLIAAALSGCGGSDGNSSEPGSSYQLSLLAGSTQVRSYAPIDPEPGCLNVAAVGAKLQPVVSTLGRTSAGELVFAEIGSCDSHQRIRAVNVAANTIRTLAVGASPVDDSQGLSTFLNVTAIATTPAGSVYIADSDTFTGQLPSTNRNQPGRGPGVWKLDSTGAVSRVAGIELPSTVGKPGLDGLGAQASFGYLSKMCYGSDGLLYLNDTARLRTVSQAGAVNTINTPSVKYQTVLACGPNGSVLVRRWFDDPSNDDYYDPISQRSIAKIAVVGRDISPLIYFGPSNPAVLVPTDDALRGLAVLDLTDGQSKKVALSTETGNAPNLSSAPPVIVPPTAGAALSATDFDTLSLAGIIRFTQVTKGQ
ncbi:hypothetical protein [Ottowia sp.]|uniref:hypothetical protein n=1 Tax=Ottowia sp. TaxID=1898956 RepID=UPI00261D860F|nr:hypothetical protein [Ottowia sp.]